MEYKFKKISGIFLSGILEIAFLLSSPESNAKSNILKQAGYSFNQDNLSISSDLTKANSTIARKGTYTSIAQTFWLSFYTPTDFIDVDFSGWIYAPDSRMYPDSSVTKHKFSLGIKYSLPSTKWLLKIGPEHSLADFSRNIANQSDNSKVTITTTELSTQIGYKIDQGAGVYLFYITTISPNSPVNYSSPGFGLFVTI